VQAAKECGINYSTAKSIVKLLKIEGRIEKKKKRISRKVKKEREQLESIFSQTLKRQKLDG
jgi:predicted transcriptional regulator